MAETAAALSSRFERFAVRECRHSSPLYEHLSTRVAGDPELLALAAHARRGQPIPNLFFAAVHFLLLQGATHPLTRFYPSVSREAVSALDAANDPYPLFRAFCRERRDEIAQLIGSR